ncbi:MAG: hypothetical protein V1661_00735 [bacterium]
MPLYIPIAWYGTIDIENLKFLYQHRLVQRLRWLSQLSEKCMEYPSCTQNRLTHSLRVYNDTKYAVNRPEISDELSPKIKKALPAVALIHDTPHSPCSHTLEPFFGHHENINSEIVANFQSAVERAGIDFSIFRDILTKKNSAHKIISDKNFGTDKLDYLKYDTHYSGFGGIPDFANIKNSLSFINGEMAACIDAIEDVKELQKKYILAYRNLYCSPIGMAWQRVTQKIAHACLESGDFTIEELRWKTDFEFWGQAALSWNHEARKLYEATKNGICPAPIMEMLVDHHLRFRENAREVKSFSCDSGFFSYLQKWRTMENTLAFEKEAAEMLGLEPWQIIFAAQDYEFRFIPTDCAIYNAAGEIFSLFGLEPEHHASLFIIGQKSLFVRISILEKSNEELSRAKKSASALRDLLDEKLKESEEAKK